MALIGITWISVNIQCPHWLDHKHPPTPAKAGADTSSISKMERQLYSCFINTTIT
jgi:hypothetical protein